MVLKLWYTNVHKPMCIIQGISHVIYFEVYPQTTFLVPQMYNNIHSHQHKIIQILDEIFSD